MYKDTYLFKHIPGFYYISYLPELRRTFGINFQVSEFYIPFDKYNDDCIFATNDNVFCSLYGNQNEFGGFTTILGWDFSKRFVGDIFFELILTYIKIDIIILL